MCPLLPAWLVALQIWSRFFIVPQKCKTLSRDVLGPRRRLVSGLTSTVPVSPPSPLAGASELQVLHPLRMIYEPVPGSLEFLNDVVPSHLIAGWGIIAVPFLKQVHIAGINREAIFLVRDDP